MSGPLEARVLPSGRYSELVHAVDGDELEISVQLADPDYGSVQGVHLGVTLPQSDADCWRLTGRAYSRIDSFARASFGPLFVLIPAKEPAQLLYVHKSTALLAQGGKLIGTLPDGVTQSGILIPYAIPPAANGPYYVNFYVRVT